MDSKSGGTTSLDTFDPQMIDKVNAYAKAHLAPSARRVAETVVASITDNMRIRRDRLKAIDEWLAHRS